METSINNQTPVPILATLIIGAAIAKRRRTATFIRDDARPGLSDETPLAATEDGLVKIWAITPSDPNTPLTLGEEWRIQAEGLYARHATTTNPWSVDTIDGLLTTQADPRQSVGVTFGVVSAPDGAVQACQATPPANLASGTHPLLLRVCLQQPETESEPPKHTTLEITLSVRVLAGPPSIRTAHSEGESDGEVNLGGAPLYIEGFNLNPVTQVELLDEAGVVFHTVSASYADDLLTTEDIEGTSRVPARGSIRVTTDGGTATYSVQYGNH